MTDTENVRVVDDRNLQHLLASRVADGDLLGWQWIYEAYFDQLFRYVYYRTGENIHLAEDIVQETFKELPGALAGFEAKTCDLYAYIVGIAKRKLSRHYAKNQRSRTVSAAFSSSGLAPLVEKLDKKSLTEEELGHQHLLKFLSVALSELSPLYAVILVDKYAHGKTVKEIARNLRKSEHAAESLLARARKRLRQAVNELRNAYFKEQDR